MKSFKFIVAALIASIWLAVFPASSLAAVQSGASQPKVSFVFDDGYASAYTQAAPILAKYGFTATDYAVTGCIGMTTTPNKCAANKNLPYMSWAELQALQNSYHWEIGSHSVTHPYLSRVNVTKLNTELSQSKSTLAAYGINATDFATPYGDYNPAVLAAIAKYYYSQRGYADSGYNFWPYSDYFLRVQKVKGDVPLATVKSYIDAAAVNNTWLILVFHDIKQKVSTGPNAENYSAAGLDQIAAYVKSRGLPVINISSGLVQGSPNLMPNGNFDSGLAEGWNTTSPTTITFNNLGFGSYPNSVTSVRLVSSTVNSHLFSPLISVNPSSTYIIKNYLYVQKNVSGGIGFYIDEYDAAGHWISGQYKATEPSVFAESLNFAYRPTSAAVAKASLQVIVIPGGTVAYLDNVQWLEP